MSRAALLSLPNVKEPTALVRHTEKDSLVVPFIVYVLSESLQASMD